MELHSGWMLALATICASLVITWAQSPEAYERQVMMDLCQFIGVKYARDPDKPACGYLACWDRRPFSMPCAPGLKIHPYFQWGDSYPCTEKDGNDECGYLKRVLGPHFVDAQGQKETKPVEQPAKQDKGTNLSGPGFRRK